MNHKNTTLAIAAIVAAAALTGVAFAIPQQAMAGGYSHRHHNNNHNGNSIKVDQAINQLNDCNSTHVLPPPPPPRTTDGLQGGSESGSGTTCLNIGANSADIHR